MSKNAPKTKPEEKLEEGKKAARVASRAKAKKEMKQAADKLVLSIADKLPHGQAKTFIMIDSNIDKLENERKKIGLALRGERAKLKEMKIEMRPYDAVRRLKKMDPEDMKSYEATVALYKEQLGLDLSPEQKVMVEDVNSKREAARAAMAANGGDTGKEVGSGNDAEGEEGDKTDAAVIPARNDAVAVGIGGRIAPTGGLAH